jgi:hypothetical protein
MKRKKNYLFLFFLEKRKNMYLISYSHSTFYNKSPQIKYTTKANKTTQKKYKGPVNKSMKIPKFSDVKNELI